MMAAGHRAVLTLEAEIVRRARRPFPEEPIRTLDAIHLAAALRARSLVPGTRLLSLDGRVRTCGPGSSRKTASAASAIDGEDSPVVLSAQVMARLSSGMASRASRPSSIQRSRGSRSVSAWCSNPAMSNHWSASPGCVSQAMAFRALTCVA